MGPKSVLVQSDSKSVIIYTFVNLISSQYDYTLISKDTLLQCGCVFSLEESVKQWFQWWNSSGYTV